mmetsp:Transcript_10586/g.29155  ORF Transcript_10586/g.29155 Transcript_10586/m.29155 type:complete len:185 (+) Transcript_10586:1788-2342(+)
MSATTPAITANSGTPSPKSPATTCDERVFFIPFRGTSGAGRTPVHVGVRCNAAARGETSVLGAASMARVEEEIKRKITDNVENRVGRVGRADDGTLGTSGIQTRVRGILRRPRRRIENEKCASLVTDGHWDGHWDGHCMAPARSTSTISKTLDPLLPPFFTRSARNTAASTVPSAYTLRPLTLC